MFMIKRGSDVPRCVCGHVTVCVTRGQRLCPVCPECLRLALTAVGRREVTVNDYLARLEGDGAPPAVGPGEAGAASALHRAAQELYDDTGAAACRGVVKDVARATDRPASEVMTWTLNQFSERVLARLRAARVG